jgi:hypothetical protein
MTERKSLKRRVRARMSKTGERYTAARHQMLAKSASKPGAKDAQAAIPAEPSAPDPIAAPATPTTSASPSGTMFRGDRGDADAAALARTGRPRAEWFSLLNAWGAADRSHPEIARWLIAEHDVDPWWSQELTVSYEMAIGRRKPGQRADGFSITGSKTVGVPVERLYAAFLDEEVRTRWLPAGSLRVRTATPYRTARFDWEDGATRVAVGFTAKGETRSSVAIDHERLPDADTAASMKAFWRERLVELGRLLEA